MEIFKENISKYNALEKLFKENENKEYTEWLVFDRILDKPGKQGVVGLFNVKNTKLKVIFKISQYINYLVFHELQVMEGLNEISMYCPHFCKSLGMINCNIDAKYRKNTENPFLIENSYPITKEILITEYIDDSCKFYNYIRSEKVSEEILYSVVKQILLALSISQKEKRFSHYDLHSFNIMMKKCDKDIVFLYKIDDENQFCIPTLGCYPVIIDFGFSYISDMDDGPLWPSMAHTDAGFLSDRFDWVADPKLFLITVSDEIKIKRRSKKSKLFRRIVKNIFYPLTIDMECGWDDFGDDGASDYVLRILEKHNKNSELFKNYDHYCIDLLQTLIILPLQEQKKTNDNNSLEKSYVAFLEEWIKIENEITNGFYNLYILKGVVNAARYVRPYYVNKQTREKSIKMFRLAVYEVIEKVSKFCLPKNVHYEKLLCSLYVFSRSLEGVLYKIMKTISDKKNQEYEKLPLKSIEQMYGVITTNIPDDYIYNKKTKVVIIDSNEKTMKEFKIPEKELENVNDITHLARGTYIYDLFRNNYI